MPFLYEYKIKFLFKHIKFEENIKNFGSDFFRIMKYRIFGKILLYSDQADTFHLHAVLLENLCKASKVN